MTSHTLSHNRQMHGIMTGQSHGVQKLSLCHDSLDEQVSIIRKEFVILTGNHFSATILNQLLYWTLRVKNFDLFLEEERTLPALEEDEGNSDCHKSHGWIYKTAHELIDETMLGISHPTMRKYLKQLIDAGWICERVHPRSKWNKTTQYRINVKKILKDLIAIGHHLPSIYRHVFASLEQQCSPLQQLISLNEDESIKNDDYSIEKSANLHSNVKNLHSNENSNELFVSPPPLSEEIPNVKFLHSNAENLHSDVSSFHSNVRNLHSYPYTENTTENKNREHTQDACAHEDKNYFDKNFSEKDFSGSNVSESDFSAEVLRIWSAWVGQGGLPPVQLTDERRRKIHGLLPLYFENDLKQWQQFCERVSRSPFLMGQGARRWRVSLDWILVEENLLKVMEGNFDDGKLLGQKIDKAFEEARTKETHTVLESITNPVWREWCSQLNFSSESHDYVSLSELKAIAHAKFLEVEDDRLVWVGSFDARTLSKIEDLRLKILPVVQSTFPTARTVRTRLMNERDDSQQAEIPNPSRIPAVSNQYKGESYYA